MTAFHRIQYQERSRAVYLTLDNPPLNVLTLAVIGELERALEKAAASELPVVVVRAAGDGAFSAGVDVEAHAPSQVEAMLESFHRVIRGLWNLDQVTVAVVEGEALGGGCELVSACDLVLATDDSSFGQPEIKLACFPPVAAAVLPRRIGHHRTCELLYLGEPIPAGRAASYGLVNWVVAADRVEEKLDEVLGALSQVSRAALQITRRAIQAGTRIGWGGALVKTEDIYLRRLARTEDMAEGVNAFLGKRKPDWRHR